MNLATALELAAHRYPEADAIITRTARYSYRQWNRRINSVAWGLVKAGIRPGDRVAICAVNDEAPATIYFAGHKAGATVVLLNARWKEPELSYAINEANIKAILFDQITKDEVTKALDLYEGNVIRIEAGRENCKAGSKNAVKYEELAGYPGKDAPEITRLDTGIGTVLYTSGTTGRPKGVCRSCRSDYYSSLAIILEHRWSRFERVLGVMPLYHTMGLHTLISMVLLNGTSVLLPRVDPVECLQYIETEKLTALYLVPTVYHDLVQTIKATGKTELPVAKLAYAGAPMSLSLVNECFTLFQPMVFVNQYGCTEMLAVSVNANLKQNPSSAGRPALHTRLRIVTPDRSRRVPPGEIVGQGETGEVIVDASSPQAFSGYLNNPEATQLALHEGWYFTGDLGFFDKKGDLYLAGRVDDMIISGGENIFPKEVETVLESHPLVREAAVVGAPDKRWGETVVAFVVPGSDELNEEVLAHFCLENPRLARYKRPRKFFLSRKYQSLPAENRCIPFCEKNLVFELDFILERS